jgi:D-alanine-D-alanine ligase
VTDKLRVAVLWRPGRNIEWQQKYTERELPDDAKEEAENHRDALIEAGHNAYLVCWDKRNPENTIDELRKSSTDLVFNTSSFYEAALLEAFAVPYCGSGLDLIALDKAARKKLLAYHEVPTAPFVVIAKEAVPGRGVLSISDIDESFSPEPPLEYPLFVKPVEGRGSSGISDESIVHSAQALKKQAQAIIERLGQAALVENYVRGREVTVGVIGQPPTALAPLEVEYNEARTNTYEHKKDNEIIHCPARLDQHTLGRVKDVALATFEVLKARDYGRIDTIVTEDGTPWVLEINTFAGLQSPTGEEEHLHTSYIGVTAKHMGLSRGELLGTIVESARRRYNI